MAQKQPVVITVRQAKKQINHFGRSLIIYVAVFMMINYGFPLLASRAPQVFMGYDPEIVTLCASMILIVFTALVPFHISSAALHLNIKDYLQNPHLRRDRVFALTCIGVCLYLITTSISTLFYFFFHTESNAYAFLGVFTTRSNVIKNILYFILVVIIKPICDEYIFQGIIQRQLGHYGRYFGVLGSAVLYALAQTNMVDAIPAFVLGWYVALITLRYHSIRPAVQIHICVQLFRWIITVMPGNFIWVINVLIIIMYIASALFIFQKRVDTSMVRYGATEKKLWRILFTSWTIVVCVILFAINLGLSFWA